MVSAPPRAPTWVSWSYAALWAIALLTTLPFAPGVFALIENRAGQGSGRWIAYLLVGTLIALCFAVATRYLIRANAVSTARFAGLMALAALIAGMTVSSTAPVEGLHFLQYGVLGLLLHRALSHHMRDSAIYIAAALIGGTVGILDEAIQWLLPNRFWDLRDIAFNFSGAVIAQIFIAFVLQPTYLAARPSRSSINQVRWLSMGALILLGLSLLNTPQRIVWYSAQVPALAAVVGDATEMIQYGFVYDDPHIGKFRSRLPEDELRREDAKLGPSIGVQLNILRSQGGD